MGSAGAFSMWFRITFGLRRAEGCWQITHLHESVPFTMDQTLKAAIGLQP
jgi:ketosteroid isomerase-like protein